MPTPKKTAATAVDLPPLGPLMLGRIEAAVMPPPRTGSLTLVRAKHCFVAFDTADINSDTADDFRPSDAIGTARTADELADLIRAWATAA